MSHLPPPVLPEEIMPPPTPQKYLRPRRAFSWFGLLIGVLIGIGGGLFYAWNIDPVEEFDTAPWQLSEEDQSQYLAAIALSFGGDGNLNRAVERLLELRSNDPIQAMADAACDLANTDYVASSSGLRAIRTMMVFYQLQGRSGCADELIPLEGDANDGEVVIIASTPTLAPPPSKTPTPDRARPTPTFGRNIVPTSPPQRDFRLADIDTFCDVELSGLIEAYVQDFDGAGIPGESVRVRWDEGEDTFFTGLKPERGPAYADFQMEAGKGYTVEMPGRSDPTNSPLTAAPCTTETGDSAIISFRVVFRPVN